MIAPTRSYAAAARVFLISFIVMLPPVFADLAWSQGEIPGHFAGTKPPSTGVEIYRQVCQGCHMPDGKGAMGAGTYPALAKDSALVSKEFMVIILLLGRRNMPGFAGSDDAGISFAVLNLTDEQIASVINYVRSHFGNRYGGFVTAAQVSAQRFALRQRGPTTGEEKGVHGH